MYIAQLGRQPELSLAELAAVFETSRVTHIAPDFAAIDTTVFDISLLGGTVKCAEIVHELPAQRDDASSFLAASKAITERYGAAWQSIEGKITLGLSAYNLRVSPRAVQKTGIILKGLLKKHGVSLRLIPNDTPALSTATSHNNKLGLSERKVELLVVKTNDRRILIAESRGAQNITAYARRDHGRPKRDAFVGMLPPKLAQIMINLALGSLASSPSSHLSPQASPSPTYVTVEQTSEPTLLRGDCEIDPREISAERSMEVPDGTSEKRVLREGCVGRVDAKRKDTLGSQEKANKNALTILDPFCGTGTVLQEALLHGLTVYGSDLSPKMVDYTTSNLDWLQKTQHATGIIMTIQEADATNHTWPEAATIDAVVCETYLGQPFSAPPSPAKLKEVVGNCNHIISSFLKNIHSQLKPRTPICIAIPAWRGTDNRLTHLPLTRDLSSLGYQLTRPPLIYSRPDQVVAREILVLKTAQTR